VESSGRTRPESAVFALPAERILEILERILEMTRKNGLNGMQLELEHYRNTEIRSSATHRPKKDRHSLVGLRHEVPVRSDNFDSSDTIASIARLGGE
jgi:hypothetical protein